MRLLNPVLSETLRGNLRFDGSLVADLAVDGTPSEPRSRGTLNGDGLRAAWVEQGSAAGRRPLAGAAGG